MPEDRKFNNSLQEKTMGTKWTNYPVVDEEDLESSDAWGEEATVEEERTAAPPKEPRRKYVARRSIERYWELKALRSHLDEFDTVDSEF
jgi:hypothetical protein